MVNYQEISNGFMFSFAVYGLILFIDDLRIVIKEKFIKKQPNEIKEKNDNETDSDDSIIVVPYTDFPEKNEDGYNTQPSDNEENNVPEIVHKRRRTE